MPFIVLPEAQFVAIDGEDEAGVKAEDLTDQGASHLVLEIKRVVRYRPAVVRKELPASEWAILRVRGEKGKGK